MIKDLWNNIKHDNLFLIGIPKGKDRNTYPDLGSTEVSQQDEPKQT